MNRELQDGMKSVWTEQSVARNVRYFVQKWNIETLITFDDYGVSGHPNHIAAYQGVKCVIA